MMDSKLDGSTDALDRAYRKKMKERLEKMENAKEERRKPIWGWFCKGKDCTARSWKPTTYNKAVRAMDQHNNKYGLEGHPTKVVLYSELPEGPKLEDIEIEHPPRGCSKCGEPGHNARTCGREKVPKKGPSKSRGCSICGEQGHYAKTCGRTPEPPKKRGGPHPCSNCGELGHYAKTCKKPRKPYVPPEPTPEITPEEAVDLTGSKEMAEMAMAARDKAMMTPGEHYALEFARALKDYTVNEHEAHERYMNARRQAFEEFQERVDNLKEPE